MCMAKGVKKMHNSINRSVDFEKNYTRELVVKQKDELGRT